MNKEEKSTFIIDEKLFFEIYDNIISSKELGEVKNYASCLKFINETTKILNKIIEDHEQLYSVRETANYLGVSEKTILRMIKRENIKFIIRGRKYYISEKEIMKYKKNKNRKKQSKIFTIEALGLIKEKEGV